MLFLKRIQKIASCFALLIILISFSGFTSNSSHYEKPLTELVFNHSKNNNKLKVKQHKLFSKTSKRILVNQFTIFNFKSLLNIQNFDFNLTLKSQKKITLRFLNHYILEQNLIAKTHTANSYSHFIE